MLKLGIGVMVFNALTVVALLYTCSVFAPIVIEDLELRGILPERIERMEK